MKGGEDWLVWIYRALGGGRLSEYQRTRVARAKAMHVPLGVSGERLRLRREK